MEIGVDFLRSLETDVVVIIFKCLDDPADLVRASLVSRYWCNFVVSNELSKHLCVATFPQLSNIAHVAEIDNRKKNRSEFGTSKSPEGDILYREHKVYASLLQVFRKLPSVTVLAKRLPYSDSSTNNNRPRWDHTAPKWSCIGQKDPNVPQMIQMYTLNSHLCVITEICLLYVKDIFQPSNPIYSSKSTSVRFRMGYPKNPKEIQSHLPCYRELAEDMFIWTYTSEEFPIAQEESCLQHFKFQEPVVCIGGYMEVQLLDRVQRKETDGLFYICVPGVKVMGRFATLKYRAGVFEPFGKLTLVKCRGKKP